MTPTDGPKPRGLEPTLRRRPSGPARGGTDEAARLGLRALERTFPVPTSPAGAFLLRRWLREGTAADSGDPEARALARAAGCALAWSAGVAEADVVVRALVRWAGAAEERGRLGRAAEILALAARLRTDDPELALRRGRIARKRGRPAQAAAHYGRVRLLAEPRSPLGRLARIGEAMVAPDPEAELARMLREAVRAGDREAAGVALEARARVRRRGARPAAAVRDYLAAAVRFPDPRDRGRVLHAAADLLSGIERPDAARDVLLAARRHGHPNQAARAAARLHALAVRRGDQVGARRWREHGGHGLTSLLPSSPGSPARKRGSRAARHVRRLRRSPLLDAGF